MSSRREAGLRSFIEQAGPRPLLLDDRTLDSQPWVRVLLATLALAAAAGLGAVLLSVPDRPPILPGLVEETLEPSGVSSAATAVLLNFRAYDTFLEIAVLVAALAAVWSLDRGTRPRSRDVRERGADPVLHSLAKLIVPLAGLMAVYLTWAGSHRPGGAFQAGALLAGAAVILEAGGYIPPLSAGSRAVRGAATLAAHGFIGIGLAGMPWTGTFLEYPPAWSHGLILTLESAITITVALTLTGFFVDVPALPAPQPELERVDPTGDPLGRLLSRREQLSVGGGDT